MSTTVTLRERLRGRRRDGRTPEEIQQAFYTEHSHRYDEMHVAPGDEHNRSLELISGFVAGFRYESVLDVGAGTGRGVRYLLDRHPEIAVRGVEPVEAMITEAVRSNRVPPGLIAKAGGDPIPFPDGAFDVVCEFGVLHHVADPDAVVSEMTRVARRAVFLSDTNRFAKGGSLHRAAKFVLYRLGLWGWAYRLATGGTPYHLNEGDGGVAYSYSVYDSLHVLEAWADRVFLVPVVPARVGWFHPLFGASTILVCALRDGPPVRTRAGD